MGGWKRGCQELPALGKKASRGLLVSEFFFRFLFAGFFGLGDDASGGGRNSRKKNKLAYDDIGVEQVRGSEPHWDGADLLMDYGVRKLPLGKS